MALWNIPHRIKFGVWNLARRNPAIASPIKMLGLIATKTVATEYQKTLEQGKEEFIPLNRYLRKSDSPTQVVVITPTDRDSDDFLGLGLFLSHLRIPYRRVAIQNADSVKADLILTYGISLDQLPRQLFDVAVAIEEPARFLPFRDGLRSNYTIRFISKILSFLRKPLITGMMPSRVALRVDDVAGESIEHYLPPALARGWKPNLGIFISDFNGSDTTKVSWLSQMSREGKVDFSPHAFTPSEFIFFDYPRGCAYSEADFRARWETASQCFIDWNFPVSSVLNTHFHCLSSMALKVLETTGVKYFFSEIALDSVGRIPSPAYLPSGDPTLTTGTVGTGSLLQIYSGDSTLDINQPSSLCDFMMHLKGESPAQEAAHRALSRLELTLNTGFASFITSHEYLLSSYPRTTHDMLWDYVEKKLNFFSRSEVRKVSMVELGDICWDHTHTCVENVREVASNRWIVRLSGKGNGACPLTVFWNQRFIDIPVPSFNGEIEIEVKNRESKDKVQVGFVSGVRELLA